MSFNRKFNQADFDGQFDNLVQHAVKMQSRLIWVPMILGTLFVAFLFFLVWAVFLH